MYRFERPQYMAQRKMYVTGSHVIVGQEKEMSAIYGAEHFLRMLGMSSGWLCFVSDLRTC